MNWEFGISRCKLSFIECINKIPPYSTGKYIQYSLINHNEKDEKIYIYMVYIYMCVCLCVCIYITESLYCTSEMNTTL